MKATTDQSTNADLDTDVVVDDSDNPHAVFVFKTTTTTFAIGYRFWNGSKWVDAETVVNGLAYNPQVAIALNPNDNDRPVIGYTNYDGNDTEVKLAAHNGTTWINNLVDTVGGEIGFSGMDIDVVDVATYKGIVVAYHAPGDSELKYAFWNGLSLTLENVDTLAVGEVSIAGDAQGQIHIVGAHLSGGDPVLRYARRNSGGGWVTEEYDDTAGMVGISERYPWVTASAAGFPRVSYLAKGRREIKFVDRDNHSTWNAPETVETVGSEGDPTSTRIHLDDNEVPWVAYNSRSSNGTKAFVSLAKRTGVDSWNAREVARTCDNDFSLGQIPPEATVAMVLDSANNPHLTYSMDRVDGTLDHKGTRYVGWKQPWAAQEQMGSSGGYHAADIDLDANMHPWICRYQANGQQWDLQVRAFDGTNWSTKLTVSNMGVGSSYARACSIEWHSSTLVGVVYHKQSGKLLYQYSTNGGNNWSVAETIVTGNTAHNSMVIDSSGTPHVAYRKSGALEYTYRTGANAWLMPETVTNSGGDYNSIAVMSDDVPGISYYENNALHYAQRAGDNDWDTETVTGTSGMGWDTALTYGPSKTPHISFYNQTDADLMLAKRLFSSWHVVTVEGTGSVGEMSAIALSPDNGNFSITYYDRSNDQLGIIYQESEASANQYGCRDTGGLGTSLVLDDRGNPRAMSKEKTSLKWWYFSRPSGQ